MGEKWETRVSDKPQSELVDVTCDICTKSVRDSSDMNYEYAMFTAAWGYGSDHDGDSWKYYLCEKCSYSLKIHLDASAELMTALDRIIEQG